MMDAFADERSADLRRGLSRPYNVDLAFTQRKAAHTSRRFNRGHFIHENLRKPGVGCQFQLVAGKRAKPCRFSPSKPSELFQNGANRGIEFSRVGNLMCDGVKRVQSLDLRP